MQKKFSIKKPFGITVGFILISILFYSGINIYLDDIEYRASKFLDKTPADCALTKDHGQRKSCYRSMYRRNSVPEVCLALINLEGEATECARRYGTQSGNISSCSVFKEDYDVDNELREIYDYPTFQTKLYKNCQLGAIVIKKDKTLCQQLPPDDGLPEYDVPSTQESCITGIDHWEYNDNFYLHPEKSKIYPEHIWSVYIQRYTK